MKRSSTVLIVVMAMVLALSVSPVGATSSGYDLGGRTVTLATCPWQMTTTPLGTPGTYDWSNPDPRLQAHIDAVEEAFNCEIQVVGHSDNFGQIVEELQAGVMAGSYPYDMVQVYAWQEWGEPIAVLSDLVWPLDDILPEDYYEKLPASYRSTAALTFQGTTYRFEVLNSYAQAVGVLWNMDMFEEEGMESPYELYRAGEWTYEKMLEISRDMVATDAEGTMTRAGTAVSIGSNPQWFLSNGVGFTKNVDGRVVVDITSPEIVAVWEFLIDLYATGGGGEIGADKYHGGAAMVVDIIPFGPPPDAATQTYRWGLVPLPKGPHTDDYAAPVWQRHSGFIPKTVDEPEAIFELTQMLFQSREPYIEDMEEWEMDYWDNNTWAFDRDSFRVKQWAERNMEYVDFCGASYAGGWGGEGTWRIHSRIAAGEDPTVVLAEQEPLMQAYFDDVVNK